MNNKKATFFGGAIGDTETKEYQETILIGELLAQHNFIVKNGGYRGLMEAISKGVKNKNGNAIGYTCKSFNTIIGNDYLSESIVCNDIYERLKSLITDSDLFIVQKGGIGTLSELFLCLDIIRKIDKKERPRVILIGDFWKIIFKELNDTIIPQKDRGLYKILRDYKQFREWFLSTNWSN